MLVSITNLALNSRLAIICLQFIANLFIPDHDAQSFKAPLDPDHVPKALDGLVNVLLGGFNRWDSQYFLHISEHGYSYENTLAFQPLFPFIVKILTSLLTNVTESWISYRELSLIIALFLNMVFFIRAAHALYRLSNIVLGNKKRAEIAVALFCLNPASIFFSAPYSEGLFCWLSFLVMIQCLDDINYSIFITIPLSLSVLCRSNGLLNIGFYVYFSLKKIMVPYSLHNAICTCSKMFVIFMLVAFHYGMAQVYIYYLFCFEHKFNIPKHVLDYGILKNFVMAGNKTEETSPWCSNRLPLSYSYVQSHYWDVGFLKYYELKQIPNFLLALPVIILVVLNTYSYVTNNWDYTARLGIFRLNKKQMKSMKNYDRLVLPFVLHAAVMTLFSIFFCSYSNNNENVGIFQSRNVLVCCRLFY